MITDKQEVLGRQFRTTADYEAACKDAEMIEHIKGRYHLNDVNEVKRLIEDLQNERYRFRTILGQDFLEETEENLEQLITKSQSEKKDKILSNVIKKNTQSIRKEKKKKINLEDYDAEMQESIRKELKKQNNIRKAIIILCSLVAGSCFIYLGVYMYQTKRLDDYASKQQRLKGVESVDQVTPPTVVVHYDNEELVIPDILEEYKTLYSLNQKLIGWIKIDDTYIDYPVLQTVNNEYYLKHNFDQQEDKNGSIFLDKDCLIFPRSKNLILYGHHMQSGRMFGQLQKYSDEKFYENHKVIQFDTIYEKGTYEVMYVFRSKIYDESEVVFKYYQFINASSDVEFDSYMAEMSEMSLYDTGVTATYEDDLLTLSTCDYYTDYGRFVVVAKKIK